jgi:hypothetical protein
MGSAKKRQARKVAARWALHVARGDWQPPIPQEALAFFRTAYLPNTPSFQLLDDARDSIGVFLPKILDLLHKKQNDRYFMNSSESKGRLFYFFSPRQPVDSFSLTLYMKGLQAFVAFGFIPYKPGGGLNIQGMISEHALAEPDIAGLAVLRLVRSVLSRLP